MTRIHPSAVVDKSAELAEDVEIGPFSLIGPHVRLGAGTRVGAHCVFDGHTTVGENNLFYAYCSVGGPPQDKKYRDEPTRLEIGSNNTLREFCTVHRGTVQDEGITRIGDDNWIMTYVHIAHDCRVGSHTILSSSAQIAGHVEVADWAILGGFAGVHQFVKIGAHSMIGGQALLLQDVPPFVTVAGSPAKPAGINTEGLKRRGFSAEAIRGIRQAYKALYRSGMGLTEALDAIQQQREASGDAVDSLDLLLSFIRGAKRGIVR